MQKILVLFFLALALVSSAFAAETINYVYSSQTGNIIEENDTQGLSAVNVTLPNTTWNIHLQSADEKFSVSMPTVTHSMAPDLFISAAPITLSNNVYTGDLGTDGNSHRYIAKYGYAFNLSPTLGKTFTVNLNYSAYAPLSSPKIVKCDFNYSSGRTENTSDCDVITPATSENNAQTSVTSFSAFYMAEDRCSDGVKNYDETGIDCGGSSCPACPPSGGTGGSGGGGGGGGGGSQGAKTIYVTPTPEGSTVQVYNGDMLIVQYNGKDYHFRVIKATDYKVTLRSLSNYLTYDIELGDDKRIGLESFLSDDIRVSMHISNEFAALTFKTFEKEPFRFPLLPPAEPGREEPAPAVGEPAYVPPAAPPSPAPGPESEPAEAPAESAPEVAVPESPINIWTIALALVFVMILVGGFVFYRTRLAHTEKPPTVTGTGEQPPSEAAKPTPSVAEPTLRQRAGEEFKKAEGRVKKAEQAVAGMIHPKEVPPAVYHIPKAKMLEAQRFIYHAYSLGYTSSQVKQKLLEQGWPEQLVDNLLQNTRLGK